jgi:chromosome segregation ATPase
MPDGSAVTIGVAALGGGGIAGVIVAAGRRRVSNAQARKIDAETDASEAYTKVELAEGVRQLLEQVNSGLAENIDKLNGRVERAEQRAEEAERRERKCQRDLTIVRDRLDHLESTL